MEEEEELEEVEEDKEAALEAGSVLAINRYAQNMAIVNAPRIDQEDLDVDRELEEVVVDMVTVEAGVVEEEEEVVDMEVQQILL